MKEGRLPGIRKERTWIRMQDGVRLAAQLWMPEDAKLDEQLPSVLEYLPYRMDDQGVAQTHQMGCYITHHGIVYARVDIRGTGASEGVLPEGEYSEQEHLDGMEVIDWLSRRPWSNGNVGMWGISWGGFNAIQMAMRRPPALKAIIALMATDDVFHDDKYIDGFVHFDEYNQYIDHGPSITRPPDFPLDEESLAARFDRPPWQMMWLREQRDGPFWWRQSLWRDYSQIEIPTLLIAGWMDGYRDSVPRMLQHMRAPMKAIVGPWSHDLPHEAGHEPRIEWRHEAVRWWDQWLKGIDTEVMNEPALSVYVRHWHPPDPTLVQIPGEWRTENGWPIERTRYVTHYLGPGRALSIDPPPESVEQIQYVPSVGTSVGVWWGEIPPDQRSDDAFSLVFDSEPLEEDVEILGMPNVHLRASADAPLAHWFVRLSDVAPDGGVSLVSGAGLNGAQRESRSDPEPLEPGVVYRFRFDTRFTSWVFPRGHRIRVAVSNSLWPIAWPSPYPTTTTLHIGGQDGSRIVLPVIPYQERPVPSFLPPDPCPPPPIRLGGTRAVPGVWNSVCRRPDGTATVGWGGAGRIRDLPWGRERFQGHLTYTVNDLRPAEASVQGEAEFDVDLDEQRLSWRAILDLRSSETHFHYRFRRELLRGGLKIRERSWEQQIPRDHQ